MVSFVLFVLSILVAFIRAHNHAILFLVDNSTAITKEECRIQQESISSYFEQFYDLQANNILSYATFNKSGHINILIHFNDEENVSDFNILLNQIKSFDCNYNDDITNININNAQIINALTSSLSTFNGNDDRTPRILLFNYIKYNSHPLLPCNIFDNSLLVNNQYYNQVKLLIINMQSSQYPIIDSLSITQYNNDILTCLTEFHQELHIHPMFVFDAIASDIFKLYQDQIIYMICIAVCGACTNDGDCSLDQTCVGTRCIDVDDCNQNGNCYWCARCCNNSCTRIDFVNATNCGVRGPCCDGDICGVNSTCIPITSYPTNDPTDIPTTYPTLYPSVGVPEECKDECDAFSVLLDNVEQDDDIICLMYVVNRLFSDTVCYKSVKQIILGLCQADEIGGKCNNNNLNELIQSVYSKDFRYIRAFGSSSGIKIDFKGKVNGEISFELCLKNVFQNVFQNDMYSNIVAFKKGRKKYLCKESYLFGLPCLNDSKFVDSDDGESREYGYGYKGYRGMSENEENDSTKRLQASSPMFWISIKGIFIVLAIVLVTLLVGFGIWWINNLRKKRNANYNKVENTEDNKEMDKNERTDNIDCGAEMVESQQCINKDFVQ